MGVLLLLYPAAWADGGKDLEPHARAGQQHARRLPGCLPTLPTHQERLLQKGRPGLLK